MSKKKLLTFIGVAVGVLAINSMVHGQIDKSNRDLEQKIAQLELENLLLKKELEEIKKAVQPIMDMQKKTEELLNDSRTKEFNKKLLKEVSQ